MLTPKILEIGELNLLVIFSIAPVFIIISDATARGKSEGISISAHVLSARATSLLAKCEFLSNSENKNTAPKMDSVFINPSFIFGFVFFVILLAFRS